MDSSEIPHVLNYYAKYYRPGMVDLSASSPPVGDEDLGVAAQYAQPGGLPELRAAIATLYDGLRADDIVVTNGASEALAVIAFALVRPGQTVSAAEDVYPSFREVATRLGAVLNGDAIGHRDSLVVVNNPTIPDGRLVDLTSMLARAEASGARLVADEVYLGLSAGARGRAVATLSGTAISVGGLSKTLGLPGLRIGWAASRDAAAGEALSRSVQLLSGGPSTVSMGAALEAVRDYEARSRRQAVHAAANCHRVFKVLAQAGWRAEPPEAGWTFLAYPPVPLTGSQLEVMRAAGFFLVPGSSFGAMGGYRLSVFTPLAALGEALALAAMTRTSRGALVLLAKAPGVGKTRLADGIGVAAAATIAEALLADTIEFAAASGRDMTIAYTPVESRPDFARLAPGATLVAQHNGDMGERIAAALRAALRRGGSAVLIGSDTPQLPPAVLDQAFSALTHADLVVGPATDGGFYLLGGTAGTQLNELFEGVAWSTGTVFHHVIANARRLGMATRVLEEVADVDDAASLYAVLRRSSSTGAAPRTRAAAAGLGLEATP
jgi:rSAM/selenodomain-associated transferase 1